MSELVNKIAESITQNLSQEELRKLYFTMQLFQFCITTVFIYTTIFVTTLAKRSSFNSLCLTMNNWTDSDWYLSIALSIFTLLIPSFLVFWLSFKFLNIEKQSSIYNHQLTCKAISPWIMFFITLLILALMVGFWAGLGFVV